MKEYKVFIITDINTGDLMYVSSSENYDEIKLIQEKYKGNVTIIGIYKKGKYEEKNIKIPYKNRDYNTNKNYIQQKLPLMYNIDKVMQAKKNNNKAEFIRLLFNGKYIQDEDNEKQDL